MYLKEGHWNSEPPLAHLTLCWESSEQKTDREQAMTPFASKLLAAISLRLDAKQILYVVDNNTAT